jgi:hypothetical protein
MLHVVQVHKEAVYHFVLTRLQLQDFTVLNQLKCAVSQFMWHNEIQ